MAIGNYKNLIVWQKSIDLVDEIYKITSLFPKSEVYGLSSQMQRAAVAIPSNIAEGQARNHLPEYIQFLSFAFASSAELETQLIIAKRQYSEIAYERSEILLTEIQKMLNVLTYKLKSKVKSNI
jgi:four helix bundle protein